MLVEFGYQDVVFSFQLLFQVFQFPASIFEKELSVDHEENTEDVEEQKDAIANDVVPVLGKNEVPEGSQKAQSFQQNKPDDQEQNSSDDGDICDHERIRARRKERPSLCGIGQIDLPSFMTLNGPHDRLSPIYGPVEMGPNTQERLSTKSS